MNKVLFIVCWQKKRQLKGVREATFSPVFIA
jgi:hypothetical protein